MSRFTSSRSFALTTSAALAVSALTLTGCSATTPAVDDGKINVVASTSVYGNLISTLGGDAVSVTSLIDNAAQDPHSYEASARDQLAVSQADLVVLNGGGYDPFAEALYESGGASAILVTAVDASGLLADDPEHNNADDHTTDDGHDVIEGFNEHVWYSFSAMKSIAIHISDELSAIDPALSKEFDSNLSAFLIDLDDLETRANQISESSADRGVAVTEPVPVYLLEAVGLRNVTPTDFTNAIEQGTDVPPTALRDVLDLIDSGHAALLAYNEQTASSETERVRQAAVDLGMPVVSFTETLPEGSSYFEWMSSNLDALAAALAD
jgi:zinc/manganese transport system substrate-binding protein